MEYEEAMTRSPKPGLFYDLSAHLVWIGDRTRNVESGHVEFCSGIRNPVAIKSKLQFKKRKKTKKQTNKRTDEIFFSWTDVNA